MQKQELNSIAKRPVVKSSPYVKLLKKGACKIEKTTIGDTKHTVLSLKEAAFNYKSQTINLAKALKAESLEKSVSNIYNFLYTHFQYEADKALQKLRSPECSFNERFTGIDCKSFTLIASTILLNQNTVHFIRRIKQPGYNSANWSHVYVIVPIDQKSADLSKGYYVIDGTLHKNKETPYIKKDDVKMSLQHQWLNGPEDQELQINTVPQYQQLLQLLANHRFPTSFIQKVHHSINAHLKAKQFPNVEIGANYIGIGSQMIRLETGLNGEEEESGDWSWLTDIDWGGLFEGTDCWGGSAYNKGVAESDRNKIQKFYNDIIEEINKAIQAKNLTKLSQEVLNFKGLSKVAVLAHNKKLAEGWNSCTTQNLENTRNLLSKINKKGVQALDAFVSNFFNVTPGPEEKFNSYAVDSFWGGYIRPLAYHKEQKFNYSIKPGITAIPAFEFNDFVMNAPDAGFNVLDYVSTLTNVVLDSTGGIDLSGNPTTTPTNGNGNGGVITLPPTNTPTKTAGIGIVPIVLIAASGIALLVQQYNNKDKANTKTKKTA